VVTICKEKSHEIVKEEFQKVKENLEWESEMKKRFARMDEELTGANVPTLVPPLQLCLQAPPFLRIVAGHHHDVASPLTITIISYTTNLLASFATLSLP